jgi:cation diffusion facilitator CzcD-associated flavoprotein CzcO
VVVVGGGQSGVSIAYQLRRKGVGRVEVIDMAAPGEAGIWRSVARMRQLQTPKTMPGPEMGNPALGFRAWFETLNGTQAFDALDRIPRLTWADYLDWFRETTGTSVRYRTRLLEVEPAGNLLRLHLESDGQQRIETTRKLVIATGFAGAGGPSIPGFLRDLPADRWMHSSGPVPFEVVAGRVVAVLGAGASAFDAAAVALEGGAAEVHLFSRRAYIDYPGGAPRGAAPVDRGHSSVSELSADLPDPVRWRNFLAGERRPASVPRDSIERVMAFPGFRLHLNSPWSAVAVRGAKVIVSVEERELPFDYIIAGTGYQIDLSAQPEFARVHEYVARWNDLYQPEAGEENGAMSAHPYLGPAFELLPRAGTGAEWVRNIHCFNLAAQLSFGKPVGDVPSMPDQPRVITAIARELYVEGVDVAANKGYMDAPVVPVDPELYQRAVQL